ncbi:MAG: isoprenyl transferase [Phycisphaeraceae bacterium]
MADLEIKDQRSAILPKHVAIIMDGNGRWAQARGSDRSYGHKAGAEVVRPIVIACSDLGLEALTLYAFSTENWTRSSEEIDTLMQLYVAYLESERQLFFDNNVRFNQIGRREGLPPEVLDALDRMKADTKDHTGLTMTLALNYGSRAEITDAVKAIADKVAEGALAPEQITEQTIAHHLYTAGLPDPDLLIRTAGEMRLSNYLLWQLSYAEFYVTDVCWPEFSVDELNKALSAYKGRTRRFGGVV